MGKKHMKLAEKDAHHDEEEEQKQRQEFKEKN